MTIAFLRASHVAPDPRLEKEVRSLFKRYPDISILAWDREGDLPRREIMDAGTGRAPIKRFSIRGKHGAGMKNLIVLLRFQFFLAAELWQMRKHLTVIHAADLSTAITGLVMARLLRVPLVYDIYDYYVDGYPVPHTLVPFVERLDIAVINRADVVLIATEARVAQLRKATPRSLHVIHNAPDGSEVLLEHSAVRPNRLVYVGILSHFRLLEEVLEVFSRRSDWELHIGGFGPLEHVISDYAGRFENIVYHGRISYRETLQLESTATALFAVYDPVVPNHKYSAPNKFYEALFLGKPIVVAKGTGVDQLVEKYDVGRVIDYNEASFERVVEEVLSDPTLVSEMGERGRDVFAREFNWSTMETRLHVIYEHLLAERRPRHH